MVELSNGSWMINSRVQDMGFRYVHISNDMGNSWESRPDTNLTDPACNASIIQYKTDEYNPFPLIFCNVNNASKRENLWVKVSFDDGQTWTKGKCIYSGPSAYSSMTVLKNGEIGVFFEKDDYKENVFTTFTFDWIINE